MVDLTEAEEAIFQSIDVKSMASWRCYVVYTLWLCQNNYGKSPWKSKLREFSHEKLGDFP